MEPVTTALVIAGVSYAGKESVGVLSKLVGQMIGPSAEAAGEGFAAPLKAWARKRNELALGTVVDAAEIVEESGATPHAVPGRILWPLLEKASVEEDEGLRALWARLLAGAATTTSDGMTLPAFVHILAELSPQEALILKKLYRSFQGKDNPPYDGVRCSLFLDDTSGIPATFRSAIEDNLVRLQLFVRSSSQKVDLDALSRALREVEGRPYSSRDFEIEDDGGGTSLLLTSLGVAFLEAVMGPGAQRESSVPSEP